MAAGKATEFPPEVSGQAMFRTLRTHTAEGMFSDPAYGGNRNMVGWKLVGYPGAQRAYQVYEFQREGTDRPPQSLAMMMPFQPGRGTESENVLLPVSGTEREDGPTTMDQHNP